MWREEGCGEKVEESDVIDHLSTWIAARATINNTRLGRQYPNWKPPLVQMEARKVFQLMDPGQGRYTDPPLWSLQKQNPLYHVLTCDSKTKSD